MDKIKFFTPISFNNHPRSLAESLVEMTDSYFYLGGKKACVLPGLKENASSGVILEDQQHPSFITTALKVISYGTVIIPLVMVAMKAILRSIYHVHIVDPKKKLEEGMDISLETIAKVQRSIEKIFKIQPDDDIIKHNGSSRNIVFSLASVPGLIFKMNSYDEVTRQRFDNMIKAKRVCLLKGLNLLEVPQATTIEIESHGVKRPVIVERALDINEEASAQEEYYQKLSNLDETIRQLAIFILETGFDDVEWRNMPILDVDPAFKGPRRIALIDLEHMGQAKFGIFGGGGIGLANCVFSKKQLGIVFEEAKRYGVDKQLDKNYVSSVMKRRVEAIASDEKLQQFYANAGIKDNPRKLIEIADLNSLGLDLDEGRDIRLGRLDDHDDSNREMGRITLREATLDVIAEINKAIVEAKEQASTKGKRAVLLKTAHGNFGIYARSGLPKGEFFVNARNKQHTWMQRIINALIEKGHLFRLDREDGHGYYLQA